MTTRESLIHWTSIKFVSATDSGVTGYRSNRDALAELFVYDRCGGTYPCAADQVDAMVASHDGEAPCLSRDDIDWTGFDGAAAREAFTDDSDFAIGYEQLNEETVIGQIDGGSPDPVYVYEEAQMRGKFYVVTYAEIARLGRNYRVAKAADESTCDVYSLWCSSSGRDATAEEVAEARGLPESQIAAQAQAAE